MSDSPHTSLINLTKPDDPLEFGSLTDRYRPELLVHCYRILGSLEDAEDALQDAMFNAWRQFATLRSQTSLRAWLYRIATNVSLNKLANRKSRFQPLIGCEPADPANPLPPPILDASWLDPLPDEYLAGVIPNPEARYETKESISLAFLTALQVLPGRQRAILILCDVMGWKPAEICTHFNLSIQAVNSLLQRARTTLKKSYERTPLPSVLGDAQDAELIACFVQAWEASDTASLVALLSDDAILTMPPLPAWYRGRDAIGQFLKRHLFLSAPVEKQFRVRATRANGCPALASYQRVPAGIYRPGALLVFTIRDGQIQEIDDFLAMDDRLFTRFNLPHSF